MYFSLPPWYDPHMSWRKKLFSAGISFLFLWLALRQVNWGAIPGLLRQVRFEFLAFMLVTLTLEGLSRAYRWGVILGDRPIRFFHLYGGLMLGYLFNNIFPARAGEFARAVYLGRRTGIPSSEAFGSVVMERFLDGVVIMSFLGISVLLFDVGPMIRGAGISALIFYSAVFVFMALLQFRNHWFESILEFVLRPFPLNWQGKAHTIQKAFSEGFKLLRHPIRLFKTFFLSFVSWGLSLTTIYLCQKAMNLPFGLDVTILLITVLSLAAMIPSSPGMIGIFEYCCVLVLATLLGQTQEVAATFGLLLHVFGYLFSLIVGMGIIFWENVSFRELEEEPGGSG